MAMTKFALFIGIGFMASVCASLAMAQCPAYDTCDAYDLNFRLSPGYSNGPAPAGGSFLYDTTNPAFYNFDVTWDSELFDLTSSVNAEATVTCPYPLPGDIFEQTALINVLANPQYCPYTQNEGPGSPQNQFRGLDSPQQVHFEMIFGGAMNAGAFAGGPLPSSALAATYSAQGYFSIQELPVGSSSTPTPEIPGLIGTASALVCGMMLMTRRQPPAADALIPR